MQNQIDLFLTCFIGGVFGGGVLMGVMYSHIKSIYIRYLKAKDNVADIAALRRLEYEFEKLKISLGDLNQQVFKSKETKKKVKTGA